MAGKVLILLGSANDKPIFDKAKTVFQELGVGFEAHVASAHRTPEKVRKLVSESDADCFIAITGLSAALPGVIAAHTTKPVIGVPVAANLQGMDALLSTAQMPPGVPVACVGIERGDNAALLAAEILSLKHPELQQKLAEYRKKMAEKVEKDDEGAGSW